MKAECRCIFSSLSLRNARLARQSTPSCALSAHVKRRAYTQVASVASAKNSPKRNETTRKTSSPKNPVNVQMLNRVLHKSIFGTQRQARPIEDLAKRKQLSIEHLKRQEIWGKRAEEVRDLGFKLPELRGTNLEEHFYNVGLEEAEPHLTLAKRFSDVSLPPRPTPDRWRMASGWTKYTNDGKAVPVEHPMEEMLVFDVEVLVPESQYPVLACAASPEAWYLWISPWLIGESKTSEHLVPLGDIPRIVVGHNVGYDRARVLEEYQLTKTTTGFLDTMSLHIAVAGLCSQQRPEWVREHKSMQRKTKKPVREEEDEDDQGSTLSSQDIRDQLTKFYDVSATNGLQEVVEFYCKERIDKSRREWFVNGSLEDVREHFRELTDYCAQDVEYTHKVYCRVLPRFLHNCPHPVSFAGMLHMGNSFLTVNETWEQFIRNAEEAHDRINRRLDAKLKELAEDALRSKDVESDPWLRQLDWTIKPRARILRGYPEWYRDSYDNKLGMLKITTRSRIAPILLKLKWNGFPLVFSKEHGWTYRVPKDSNFETKLKPCKFAPPGDKDHEPALFEDTDAQYFRVPHKDGEGARCGNPLAKGYISHFESNTLMSEYEAAREALDMNAQSAYWISARDRIKSQYVVWEQAGLNMGLPRREGEGKKNGMILPQIITMGTITRRAVEKTWLTASNAKPNRIGSELKAMVRAPPGYKIVGADVDSEELWISSVIGDAQFRIHGATALGWMTLQGSKAEGTDLHSKTARILGISREKAKIFNYARIYGAGVNYAGRILLQYNPSLDAESARERAVALYESTKGVRHHSKGGLFKRPFWHGGSESYMFNALEEIALSPSPRTPVLGCAITDALKPQYNAQGEYLPSRINWVVQSSGVDYLHLLLVSMSHLIKRYQIQARFMLSVHDEVRYLSTEEDQYRTALALQISNLWTRAMFSYRLGMDNLPQSVAFFSAVDIDHVLRKEPFMECKTPSHSTAIEPGVCLNIDEILEKTNGGQLARDAEKKEKQTNVVVPDFQLPPPLPPAQLNFLEAQMHTDLKQYKEQQREKKSSERIRRRGGSSTMIIDATDLEYDLLSQLDDQWRRSGKRFARKGIHLT
ncbi:uncharacterized protein VTP21DRAFT_11249 [Calcarisporiella thermophila]|uniref:uncharacterized protein n=1 Tax=Calcarisporiella thermophila TaxID=911321 RepID=UPI0037436413